MARSLLALVTSAAILASSGCYYVFGTGPKSPGCTSSRALPIADTVIAIEGALALGLGTFGLVRIRDDGSLPAGEGRSLSALLVVMGLPMVLGNGLSARAGYRDSSRCRAKQPPPPPAYQPGPPGGASPPPGRYPPPPS